VQLRQKWKNKIFLVQFLNSDSLRDHPLAVLSHLQKCLWLSAQWFNHKAYTQRKCSHSTNHRPMQRYCSGYSS